MDQRKRAVLAKSVQALVEFRREFNLDLTPNLLAELYVALSLDLPLPMICNQPGWDLKGVDGKRYQVKKRGLDVLNVDVNNFDFDYLILVNLRQDYSLLGLWMMDVDTARRLFVHRVKFRKHQLTQKVFKEHARQLALPQEAKPATA